MKCASIFSVTFEVGDDAVLHRLDRHDVAGRAPEHLLGFLADRLNLAGHLVNGNDRGLVDDNALAARVDARIGGAEIDSEIAAEQRKKRAETQKRRPILPGGGPRLPGRRRGSRSSRRP
jgi:hypothetical protein